MDFWEQQDVGIPGKQDSKNHWLDGRQVWQDYATYQSNHENDAATSFKYRNIFEFNWAVVLIPIFEKKS